MKRHVMLAVLATVLAAGIAGCGKKEIEELRGKVAGLEKELADSRLRLETKDRELLDAQNALKAKEEEGNRLRVERDKCKQDLAALKKKTPTKTKKR